MSWSEKDIYLFNHGKYLHAYERMGAHPSQDGGVYFSVWAPGAESVYVCGSFNDWRSDEFPLEPLGESGIWNGCVSCAQTGDLYKYVIRTDTGETLYKSDPYSFKSERRPKNASVIYNPDGFEWNDYEWLDKRTNLNHFKEPMNIYEVHAGSWRRQFTRVPGEPEKVFVFDPKSSAGCEEGSEGAENFLSYTELADELIPYVKEMGYTHIEFLPLCEHPLDESWGYQLTGYFAPTSRFGSPEDLMYLVNKAHTEGIGIIMDWVPGHFCRDEHGLSMFNGHMLYEKKEQKEWGTFIFDFSRPEVKTFLLSNAYFWLKYYHFDGIRVDGVSNMLYLNYAAADPQEKEYNINGGEENLEAAGFLREFNQMVGTLFPGVFTVAEESSSWPLVTYPPYDGGLGFHYKWNMGWENDTLNYFSVDFPERSRQHNLLTFSMTYAFSENFILPFSHDEVVHGKKSLIGRMRGSYEQQFQGIRTLAVYQMCHPGAKLTFMGCEFAQFIEWRCYEALEWFLLDYDQHKKYHEFIKCLNHIYLETPALFKDNFSWDGFCWIDCDNSAQSILSFARFDREGGGVCICILNLEPIDYPEYRLGVPQKGIYEEILSSDDMRFGGGGRTNAQKIPAEDAPMHRYGQSINIRIPPLSGIILSLKK